MRLRARVVRLEAILGPVVTAVAGTASVVDTRDWDSGVNDLASTVDEPMAGELRGLAVQLRAGVPLESALDSLSDEALIFLSRR